MLSEIIAIGFFIWVLTIELRIRLDKAPVIEFESSFLKDISLKELDLSGLQKMHAELQKELFNSHFNSKHWYQLKLMLIQLEAEIKSRKEQSHS